MRHAAWLAGLLLASLAAAAAQEVVTTPAPTLATTTSAGVQHVTYTGPLLWTLVRAAQPVDEPGSGNTALQHTFLARGQDGYAVALSIGEIDPRMEGKQVVVANARDGQPMATLRLVVPGDLHAARSVRDLVAIEVR